MNKTLSVICIITLLAAFFSGCANVESNVRPAADFKKGQKFYVSELPADERGINYVIVEDLRARGFQAKTGPEDQTDPNANYVLFYQDRWMWDITMYMHRLNIQIRNQAGSLVATAETNRSSLERKSPEFIVDETLDDIFRKVNPALVTEDAEDSEEKSARVGGRSRASGEQSHEF